MIRRLRTKFIIMAMVAVFVLLGIVVAGMNLVNYRAVIEDARQMLSVLAGNKGRIPELERPENKPETNIAPPWAKEQETAQQESREGQDSVNPSDSTRNQQGMHDEKRVGRSAEAYYEARFFSVLFDEEGNILKTNTRKIFTVSEAEADELSAKILAESRLEGLSGEYLFLKTKEEEGTRITFLDCGRKLASARTFLLISLIAAAVGYAAFFFVIFFYSKRITKPVVESYEKQKRFITDAGHEIKTPLAIIKADTDVLEMDLPDNEWIEDIQNQTRRLTSLTNDLVSLARMEESGQTLNKEEVRLSELVEEESGAYLMLAQTGGKELNREIEPALLYRGDDKMLRRLVNILLDNAMKYSPEFTVVSVELKKSGRHLRLSVTNRTEEDLSGRDLQLLFDRFYRMDASRNSETGGHGIGLSMAKAITEAHGGKISASSEDGHSLKIEVLLPVS